MVNRALIAARRSLFAARKKAAKLQAASGKPGKAPPIAHLHIFKFAHWHICFHSLVFSTGIISSFHCLKFPATIRLLASFTSHR